MPVSEAVEEDDLADPQARRCRLLLGLTDLGHVLLPLSLVAAGIARGHHEQADLRTLPHEAVDRGAGTDVSIVWVGIDAQDPVVSQGLSH